MPDEDMESSRSDMKHEMRGRRSPHSISINVTWGFTRLLPSPVIVTRYSCIANYVQSTRALTFKWFFSPCWSFKPGSPSIRWRWDALASPMRITEYYSSYEIPKGIEEITSQIFVILCLKCWKLVYRVIADPK